MRLRTLFSSLPIFLLTGISNGLFGQMLYVANGGGDDTISAYVIDQESGYLTELTPRALTSGSPSSVVVHPNGKFLYATNGGNGNLNVNAPSIGIHSINPATGALTLVGSVALTPGSGPAGAAIDTAGKFLFFVNGGPSTVSVYAIDASTGALTQVPGSPFTTPQGPTKVVVHPNGKFAYVTSNTAGVAAFSIGANGALTALTGSPFAGRAQMPWMTMDSAGKFLFVAERQDFAILVYAVNPDTGALTQVGNPFPAGGVVGVAVDPAGKFLYASNFGAATVTAFTIGATGALTQNPRGIFLGILGAFSPIVDPSDKFLYVTGQTGGGIQASAIDATTGALTPLPQQFFGTGSGPTRAATVLLSPPVIPPMIVDSVTNFFSHVPAGMPNGGLALGSKISISGKNIGPAGGTGGDGSTVGTEVGGASVQIQSGDVTTAALMVYAENTFVAAVIPSTTPLGAATVTVTYKGRTSAPMPVTITPATFGIRTLSGNGSGPAKARNATADIGPNSDIFSLPGNQLDQTAKPGGYILLQGGGLGATAADETQTDLIQVLDVQPTVFVGNKSTIGTLAVRVNGGVDFILFKLPDDVQEGCYVPVAVQTGGVTSNVASISVAASGGTCSDPGGLSASDIDAAQKSGGIRMGTILLSHVEFGPFGSDDSVTGMFKHYDYGALLQALSPGNDGPGIRSGVPLPPFGTCTLSPGAPSDPDNLFNLPGDQTPAQSFSVGAALNLNGPRGLGSIPGPDYSLKLPELTPGDYIVDNGAGIPTVAPFKATIRMMPPLNWTNRDAITSVDRTQDLTVTWTGGVADKEFVLIVGVGESKQATGAFFCTEKVSAGKFTVPAWVLSSLPKSDLLTDKELPIPLPGGLLGVGTASLTSVGKFTANGLDFGLITYEQAVLNILLYQ